MTTKSPAVGPGGRGQHAGVWQHTASFARDFLDQLKAVDFLNTLTLFAGSILLSVLPLIILISSLASRRIDSAVGRHMGLNARASRILSQLFESSPQRSAGTIAVAVAIGLAGSIAVASSLQSIYMQVFGQPHRGARDLPRLIAWTGILVGVLLVDSTTSHPIRAEREGRLLVNVVTFAVVCLFVWWTMHFLLSGRVPWRRLLPAAILTGLFWVGLELFAATYFSSAIVSDNRLYGRIGVVFSLMVWFIALAAVVVFGAVGGAVLERRRHEDR